jgi:hypothetical protein
VVEVDFLAEISLYKIDKVNDSSIKIVDLLNENGKEEEISWNKPCIKAVTGDIVLFLKEKREITKHNKNRDNLIHYPVQKIKGRFSDVREYEYLKMKVLYDFNLHYLGKKEIEAVEKDPAHIKFEKLIDQNQTDIEELITYNADERVEPFNHTDYEVASILNSKKIFRQEIGEKFDWGWSLMEIYQLDENDFVSYKQSSYFRERQRGEFFEISKKAVDFMRTFEDDKDDFLD